MVDAEGRIGRVTDIYAGHAYLRPPGGGREWRVLPETLRDPTDEELSRARLLGTPVPTTR